MSSFNLSKLLTKRALVTASLVTFVFVGSGLYAKIVLDSVIKNSIKSDVESLSESTATPVSQPVTAKQVGVSVGLPVRLRIPSIKVDARIENVRLTKDGAVDVPKGKENAGWYTKGPRPGELGSSVMVGHFGWWKEGDRPTVFNELHKLKKGDKLYVEDKKGRKTTFVVKGSRRYDPKADATEVFRSKDGKAHLNLITCEGPWNKVTNSYPTRLVVFTEKIDS